MSGRISCCISTRVAQGLVRVGTLKKKKKKISWSWILFNYLLYTFRPTQTLILRADSLCVWDLESFLMISTPVTGAELPVGAGRLHTPSNSIVCSLTVPKKAHQQHKTDKPPKITLNLLYTMLSKRYVRQLPASNSNSAPSALVSLCKAAPQSGPCVWSGSMGSCSLGLGSWLGRGKPTALKPCVTTINFIHWRASATKPFLRVTRAGSPSFWKIKMNM